MTDLTKSVPVTIENLVKSYGAVPAIRTVNLDIEAGSTVTLLGPSGCGKTTTLRCIAGLEKPTGGRITIGGKVVCDSATDYSMPPEQRRLGMVFQSYAIWPHMTVGGNVGFPLQIARMPKAEIRDRVAAILELVGLGELQFRSAAALSGGQQQRVALARALVHQPPVVLFDEPLSNLDANLRERMRSELQVLQGRLGFTAIYVTHDQAEAMALSDRVVVMNRGVIEQEGTPSEVFQNPQTAFTARFLGYGNVFQGSVASVDGDGVVRVELDKGVMLETRWRAAEPPKAGQAAVVAFRADRVEIERGPMASRKNVLSAEVQTAAFLGTHMDYTLAVDTLQIQSHGAIDHAVARGAGVVIHIAPEHCHAFPRE